MDNEIKVGKLGENNTICTVKFLFSFSGHKVRPINDPFRPHDDCILLVVSLTVIQMVIIFLEA